MQVVWPLEGPRTKVCSSPYCGERDVRFFRASAAEVDGLHRRCDGCRYKIDTFKRLVRVQGMSPSEAEREWGNRFNVPDKLCKFCDCVLPARFFRKGQGRCIGCVRQYKQKKPATASVKVTEQECTKCRQVLPATSFHRNRATLTGLQVYCKACITAVNAKNKRDREGEIEII